jgi:hypothetical protein
MALSGTENLRNCMHYRCCNGNFDGVDGGSCQKTEGHFGETFSDFANHDSLSFGGGG